MSGIEVVGLVLGAFPLAISALEHYRESCSVLNLLANFEQEWHKALNDIKDEQLLFTLNLKVLLLPLAADRYLHEDDLETLLAEPGGQHWRHDNIDRALEDRLGSSHKRFVEIVQELCVLITKLLTIIGVDKPRLQAKLKLLQDESRIDPQGKLMKAALLETLKNSFRYRTEQVKSGFGKAQREEILSEIRSNNKKLDRLLEKCDKVVGFCKAQTKAVSPKAVKSLLHYWKHANTVYALMYRSWGCSCQNKHCAHLWLQHHTSPSFEFKLLVLWAPKSLGAQTTPPWNQQGLRITCFEGNATSNLINVNRAVSTRPSQPRAIAGTADPTMSTGISTPDSAKSKKRRKVNAGVRFCLPTAGPSASTTSPSTLSLSAINMQPDTLHREISKLCESMTACGMQPSCIGSLTDRTVGGSQYSVFSQPDQKITAGEITLGDVLRHPSPKLGKLSDRVRIALAIASSHLQLQSTPWARKQWESSDIRFPQNAANTDEIMFDRPYVSADFNDKVANQWHGSKKYTRSFACLGIMLLELLFGECLEQRSDWQWPGFSENKTNP